MSDASYRDSGTLRELYHEEGMSSRDIADRFGCSKSTVLEWMDRHDIPTRKSTHEKPPNYRTANNGYEEVRAKHHGEYYSVLVHRLVAAAEYGFDAVCDAVVHHQNEISWDNRPSNLECMSRSEHVSEHHERGDYEEHLNRLHQNRDDQGRLMHYPVEQAWGGEDS